MDGTQRAVAAGGEDGHAHSLTCPTGGIQRQRRFLRLPACYHSSQPPTTKHICVRQDANTGFVAWQQALRQAWFMPLPHVFSEQLQRAHVDHLLP